MAFRVHYSSGDITAGKKASCFLSGTQCCPCHYGHLLTVSVHAGEDNVVLQSRSLHGSLLTVETASGWKVCTVTIAMRTAQHA